LASVPRLATAARAGSAEYLRIEGQYYAPKQDEDWNGAYGGELKWVTPVDESFAIALSVGYSKWEANDDVVDLGYTPIDSELAVSTAGFLDGEAALIPLGFSGLWRSSATEPLSFELEAGLRYVLVNSDVDVVVADLLLDQNNNLVDAAGFRESLDINNFFACIVAADIRYAIDPRVRLFLGAGYQFDLTKPDAEASDLASETDFSAAFLRAGVEFDL
jgi:hypothetical protein